MLAPRPETRSSPLKENDEVAAVAVRRIVGNVLGMFFLLLLLLLNSSFEHFFGLLLLLLTLCFEHVFWTFTSTQVG